MKKDQYYTKFLAWLSQAILVVTCLMFSLPAYSGTPTSGQTYQWTGADVSISGATFSQFAGTYTPIASPVNIATGAVDDVNYGTFNIGFSFTFDGNAFTTFGVNSNGFIRLGGTPTNSTAPLTSTTSTVTNVISALGFDLLGTSSGRIDYFADATSLTVQFSNFQAYSSSTGSGDNFNFQIKLFNSTNTIQIVYGSFTKNATNRNAQVGIKTTGTTIGTQVRNREVPAADIDWSASNEGTANNAVAVLAIPAVVLSNTGSPGAGNIGIGMSNVTLRSIALAPLAGASFDLNSITLSRTGTATTTDMSNFRIVYDANQNGIMDGGEVSVSGAGVALASPTTFTITGQSGISSERRYILVADVSAGAVSGRTYIPSSLATSGVSLTTTAPFSGSASGSTQTIVLLPSNDACSNAILVNCSTGMVAGSTTNASTLGQPTGSDAGGNNNGCGAGGSSTGPSPGVWYRYNNPTSQIVTLTTCASVGFDTRISVYEGSCSSLSCVAGNDDATCTYSGLRSTTQFNALANTDYYILVHGYSPSSKGNFELTITCSPLCLPATQNDICADAISLPVQPNGTCPGTSTGDNSCASAGAGSNPSCASTFGTIYDVWYSFNSGSYSQLNLYLSDNTSVGVKYALYEGACGSLNQLSCNSSPSASNSLNGLSPSTNYFLRVWTTDLADRGIFNICLQAPPPPPANDNCADAIAVSCNSSTNGTTVNASLDSGLPDCGGGNDIGVWYVLHIGSTPQNVTAAVCDADFDTYMQVFSGDCNNLTCIGSDDDGCDATFNTLASQFSFPTVANTDYFIYVSGFGSNTGNFVLTVDCSTTPTGPPNDVCSNAIPIACNSVTAGSSTGATIDNNFTSCGSTSSKTGVWYVLNTGSNDAVVDLALCNSGFDTYMRVFSGNCSSLTCVDYDDDGCDFTINSLASELSFNATANTDYYILVSGFGTNTGDFELSVNCTTIVPITNDDCANAIPVACGSTTAGSNINANADAGLPTCGSTSSNTMNGVWYVVNTGTYPGEVTAAVCNSSFDTYMRIFTGDCNSLTCVGSDDDGCDATYNTLASQKTFIANANTDYYIFISGFSGATGTFDLTVECALCTNPPVGGTLSGPLTGCTSQDLTYSLSGSTGNIQGQISTTGLPGSFVDIPGATGSSYTSSFPAAGTYYIQAKVSSPGCPDAFSNILTVNIAPGVTPFDIGSTANSICPGGSVDLYISSNGEADAYSFSTSTGGVLEDMTGATSLIGTGVDDGASSVVPIGFSFTYGLSSYTDFSVSSNGNMGLGTSAVTSSLSNSTNGGSFPKIMAMWDDMHTGNNGGVSYKVIGAVGARKLIVEFRLRRFSTSGGTDYTKTAQVWLFEGSNMIKLVYGNNTEATGFSSASIGLSTSSGHYHNLNTTATHVSSSTSINNSNSAWPGAGRVYTYTPPSPTGTIAWTSDIGGFSASGGGPHTVMPSATTVYTATITSANGCTLDASKTITLNPVPVPGPYSFGNVCANGDIQLFSTNVDPGASFTWSGPSFSSVDQPTGDATVSGAQTSDSGPYTLTVTNSYGCSASASINITVYPNPELFTLSVTPVSCLGGNDGAFQVRVTPGTGSPGFTYFGSGLPANPSGNFINRTAGTYNVFVSDVNGCVSQSPWPVEVTTVPNEPPYFTSCPSAVTKNNDANQCGAIVTYALPVAADACPGLGAVVRTAGLASGSLFPIGTTVVTHMVTDAQGATATCSFSVTINDNQNPAINNLPGNIFACNPISWPAVTVSDNCAGAQLTSTHSPGTFPSGTTTVMYTATDVYGNTATGTFTVTVKEPSVAATGISSDREFNNICSGESINLSVVGGSLGYNASWKWYKGSGACGSTYVNSGATINVAPTATTTYFARAEGECNTTACVQITVVVSTSAPPGPVTYSYLPPFGAPGVNDIISVNPVPGAVYYRWFTINGHENSVLFNNAVGPVQTSAPTVNVSFILPEQNYHIRVIAVNACGRTVQSNTAIRGTVDAPTSITGPTVVCPGDVANYTVSQIPSQTPITYEWNLIPSSAGTISGTGLTRTITFAAGFTSAQLCVHGVSTFGLAGPDYCINITSNSPAPGAILGNTMPCEGSSGNSYSIGPVPGATSYLWTCNIAGSSISGSGLSVNISYPSNAFSGTVCVQAISSCGTSVPTCLAVTSGAPGVPGPISGPVNGMCGVSGNYSLSAPGATDYDWQLPAGATLGSANHMNSVNINFASGFAGGTITVVVSYPCGTANATLTVSGVPAAPTVTPGTICGNTTELYFASSPTTVSMYNWTITGANSYNCQNPPLCSIEFVDWAPTGGTITVTSTNNCGNSAPTSFSTNCRLNESGDLNSTVYPNPTTGVLNIEYQSLTGGQHNVTVTDLAGRIILSKDVEAVTGNNRMEIDLGFVNKGLYMLYLRNNQGQTSITKVAVE